MSLLAHRLACIGAASQLFLLAAQVMLWISLIATIGAMDTTQANNMDLVMSEVGKVTQSMTVAADRMILASLAGMAALTLFIVALVMFRYRRRWAFWFSCIYGAFLLLLGFITIPFGAFLLIYVLIHRREFARMATPLSPSQAAPSGAGA